MAEETYDELKERAQDLELKYEVLLEETKKFFEASNRFHDASYALLSYMVDHTAPDGDATREKVKRDSKAMMDTSMALYDAAERVEKMLGMYWRIYQAPGKKEKDRK